MIGTRSNGLEHRKFHINTQKNLFSVRVMEHWNRLPRKVMKSPSMQMFKTHLNDLSMRPVIVGYLF